MKILSFFQKIKKIINLFLGFFLVLVYSSCENTNNNTIDKSSKNTSNSLEYKLLSQGKEGYPVIIFLHGSSGNMENYNQLPKNFTKLFEDFTIYGINGPLVDSTSKNNNPLCWFNFDYSSDKMQAVFAKIVSENPDFINKNQYSEEEINSAGGALKKSGIVDYESLGGSAEILEKTIKEIKSKENNKNTILLGYSQGGMMAYKIALKYPSLINGVISLMSMPISFEFSHDNSAYQHLKIFAINGEQDLRISKIFAEPLNKIFKSKLPNSGQFIQKFYNLGHFDFQDLANEANNDQDFIEFINNLKPQS